MQFPTIFSLLVAAVAVSAAPTAEVSTGLSKRLESIPLGIYVGDGCNDQQNPFPVQTANVPTDSSCFGIAVVLPGNTNSALISDAGGFKLPAGCSLKYYWNSSCDSENVIEAKVGQCGTFGPGKFIHSARTFGTC